MTHEPSIEFGAVRKRAPPRAKFGRLSKIKKIALQHQAAPVQPAASSRIIVGDAAA
jgi:hypothetical protein